MGRKPKFIEILTEDEKVSLQRGYAHGKSPLFRRKCHCILQSNSGKTSKELASFFQVNSLTVLSWFKLWENKGIEGLKLKAGRGRKPKLNPTDQKHVKMVKTLIENDNQNLNKVSGQLADRLGTALSKKTLQRFLKSLGIDGNDSADA
jgi:transposase